MDPNKTLNQIRAAIKEDRADEFEYSAERCEEVLSAFETLDQWLTKGGSPPDDWERTKHQEPAPKCCGADMEPVDFKWQCSYRSHHTQ